jgi:hypothetical protein
MRRDCTGSLRAADEVKLSKSWRHSKSLRIDYAPTFRMKACVGKVLQPASFLLSNGRAARFLQPNIADFECHRL